MIASKKLSSVSFSTQETEIVCMELVTKNGIKNGIKNGNSFIAMEDSEF